MDIFEQVAEMRAEEARELTRRKERENSVKNLLPNTDHSLEKNRFADRTSSDSGHKNKK